MLAQPRRSLFNVGPQLDLRSGRARRGEARRQLYKRTRKLVPTKAGTVIARVSKRLSRRAFHRFLVSSRGYCGGACNHRPKPKPVTKGD